MEGEGGHGLVNWSVDGDDCRMNRAGDDGYGAAGGPLEGCSRRLAYFLGLEASSGENMPSLRATAQCWKPAGKNSVILEFGGMLHAKYEPFASHSALSEDHIHFLLQRSETE